jgi:hypothetical protein
VKDYTLTFYVFMAVWVLNLIWSWTGVAFIGMMVIVTYVNMQKKIVSNCNTCRLKNDKVNLCLFREDGVCIENCRHYKD